MFTNNKHPTMFKKITHPEMLFGWEIMGAILLKFLLLGVLWWLFFAGHKQVVDGSLIANHLYGDYSSAAPIKKNQEKP